MELKCENLSNGKCCLPFSELSFLQLNWSMPPRRNRVPGVAQSNHNTPWVRRIPSLVGYSRRRTVDDLPLFYAHVVVVYPVVVYRLLAHAVVTDTERHVVLETFPNERIGGASWEISRLETDN